MILLGDCSIEYRTARNKQRLKHLTSRTNKKEKPTKKEKLKLLLCKDSLLMSRDTARSQHVN